MRLIDGDTLMNTLQKLFDKREKEQAFTGGRGPCVTWNDAIYHIKSAHTIDAVPVVRCKDCKWWDKSEDSPFGYCMAMKHGYMSTNWEIGIYRRYKGDFYCADGEREGKDE